MRDLFKPLQYVGPFSEDLLQKLKRRVIISGSTINCSYRLLPEDEFSRFIAAIKEGRFPRRVIINFDYCEIKDEHIEQLSKALCSRHCREELHFTFQGNHIGDDGLHHIVAALHHLECPRNLRFDLTQNKGISAEAVEKAEKILGLGQSTEAKIFITRDNTDIELDTSAMIEAATLSA